MIPFLTKPVGEITKICHVISATVITIFLWLFLVVGVALAQESDIQFSARPAEQYKASSIAWFGHFGGRKGESQTIYMLMSQGGFLAPTSSNYEDLVKAWLAKHPRANVISVHA